MKPSQVKGFSSARATTGSWRQPAQPKTSNDITIKSDTLKDGSWRQPAASFVSSLSAMEVAPLGIDEDLAQAIRSALPRDRNISEYLEQLKNPELSRTDDVQEYLERFSM